MRPDGGDSSHQGLNSNRMIPTRADVVRSLSLNTRYKISVGRTDGKWQKMRKLTGVETTSARSFNFLVIVGNRFPGGAFSVTGSSTAASEGSSVSPVTGQSTAGSGPQLGAKSGLPWPGSGLLGPADTGGRVVASGPGAWT